MLKYFERKTTMLLVCLFASTMLQAIVYKTDNATAGGLSAALAAIDKNALTELTVTGKMDARDMKFIRDNMPKLAVLNISGVSIQAYSGTAGTETASTTYPANELPKAAFCKADYSGNNTLVSVVLPGSLTSIGAKAFSGCGSLRGISIPASVKSIGDYAFYGCSALTGVNMPSGLTYLGISAFTACSGLTSIVLPASVTAIGDWTFGSCTGLTSVSMPSSITSIGNYTFYGCTSLKDINLPGTIVSIGESAFSDCSNLSKITIPNTVKTIANSTFSNCSHLATAIIPTSVTAIGDWAFLDCGKLTEVKVPGSVTSLGSGAFYNCTGFTGFSIPNSVTAIGENAFFNCTGLTLLNVYAPIPVNLASNVFTAVDKEICTLNVPINSKTAYMEASVWNEFFKIQEGSGSIPSELPDAPKETLSVYPNPVVDGFYIAGLENVAKLSVTDPRGKILLHEQVKTDDYIPMETFPKGMYFVCIQTSQGQSTFKILKK